MSNRRNTHWSAPRRRTRPGFTLIETIAAIILLDVGLLALVAGSTVLVRQTTQLRARYAAMHIASNRLETLGAAGCAAASGDVTLPDGTHEWWSAAVQPNFIRELRDSVSFSLGQERRTFVLRTRLPC